MKIAKIINSLIFLTLLFPQFPPTYAAWQLSTGSNDAVLPQMLPENGFTDEYYDNKIFVTTDSGENWKVITIGISNYYYGSVQDETATELKSANMNSGGNFVPDLSNNRASAKNTTFDTSKAKLVNYLVKITRYIKYEITCEGGSDRVSVTREKLTQGLYNFRLDGSGIIKTFNYYKLENEKGTFKDEWFS